MSLVLNPARPFFYLLAYLAVMYLRPQEYVPSLLNTPLVPIMMCLLALPWLVAQNKNFEAPHHSLMPCLLGVMAISLVFAGWVGGVLWVLNDFIPTMLVFYVVSTSVDDLQRFRAMALVLTGLAAIIAAHSVGQIANPEGIGWTGARLIDGRVTFVGLLNDPNDLSMALLIALPFSFYLANTSSSFIAKLVYLASAGLIMYGVFLANSRGAMLGLLAMMMSASVKRFGWARSLAVIPVLAAAVFVLGPSRTGEMSADEESAAGRIDAWYEGFYMFRTHPIFGVGRGMFTEYNQLTAHNSFVLAIAELGVVGYFVWLSFFVLAAVMLYRLINEPEPERTEPPEAAETPDAISWSDLQLAARTLGYSFIGAMLTAFFLSRSYVVFLYLLVGLIVAVYQMARTHWPSFEAIRMRDFWGRLVGLEIGSILALWALTLVLLRMD